MNKIDDIFEEIDEIYSEWHGGVLPIGEERIERIKKILTEQLTISSVSSSFTADEVVSELEQCDTIDDAVMFFKQNWIE